MLPAKGYLVLENFNGGKKSEMDKDVPVANP